MQSHRLSQERLDYHRARHPELAEPIARALLRVLRERNVLSALGTGETAAVPSTPVDRPEDATPQDPDEGELLRLAALHLTPDEIDEVCDIALSLEEVHRLEDVVNRAHISFQELAEEVRRFCAVPTQDLRVPPEDALGACVALTRHLISDQLEYIAVAKHHLRIRYFDELTRRMVGPPAGMGRIGGKAGGMLLAHRILRDRMPDSPGWLPITIPESYFLRSDVVQDFLRLNRLSEYQSQKYKPIEQVARDYPLIRRVFRQAEFPATVVLALGNILERLGRRPLIVRSSSLLEDRVGTAFCGKYASVFVANQGDLDQRLRALLGAIADVYASVFGPDPILYRREHELLDYVEEMGVIIQEVVGCRHGRYFLPAFAGVAVSRNEFRWSPRIRREHGLIRLVMGLGTRAVDRTGSERPRLVAPGVPSLRPESSVEEIRSCAQQHLDVIDLEANELRAVRLADVLAEADGFPWLDRLVSVHRQGGLYAPATALIDAEPDQLCITFEKLLAGTPFAQQARWLLSTLEHAYGRPVDIEFACDGEKLYLLQCRTLTPAPRTVPVALPSNIAPDRVIFDADRHVSTARVANIQYVVYVDPETYDGLSSRDLRFEAARVVGRVNRRLPRRSFILMGPGRWGSQDIRLGVPVQYADINRAALLIEIARERGGFTPELSFGTHFFQDLVEAQIPYLPLYPDQRGRQFQEAFFHQKHNILSTLLPDCARLGSVVRVIDVPAVAGGATLTVAMDGDGERALAYLVAPAGSA